MAVKRDVRDRHPSGRRNHSYRAKERCVKVATKLISSSRPMMASMASMASVASQLSSGSYPGIHWSCSQALRTKEALASNTKGVITSPARTTSRANGMSCAEEKRASAAVAASGVTLG